MAAHGAVNEVAHLGFGDLWWPASFAAAAVLGVAMAARIGLSRVESGRRHATVAASVGLALFAFVAGLDALPVPAVGGGSWQGPLFGAALAAVALALPWRARAGHPPEPLRAAPVVFGLSIGLLPLLAWVGAEGALAFEDPAAVTETRARWRHRLVPGDPRAWLGMAHGAERAGQDDRAMALAAVAARLGTSARLEAATLELRSGLLAERGECERARELFDRALVLRAREALDTLDLDLSESYRLPPSLATRCGLAQEPAAP